MTEDDARRMADPEADNRRLRHLLEQRDAPDELRHRMRSTLAVLRGPRLRRISRARPWRLTEDRPGRLIRPAP